ncbi:MAG: hypothetical protein ABFC89_11350 [Methanospirillum sp.]
MSTPQCSRRTSSAAIPVSEDELGRFRRWLVDHGYRGTTALVMASHVRTAYAHGITDPAGVGAAFPNRFRTTRGGMRLALRQFRKFRATG